MLDFLEKYSLSLTTDKDEILMDSSPAPDMNQHTTSQNAAPNTGVYLRIGKAIAYRRKSMKSYVQYRFISVSLEIIRNQLLTEKKSQSSIPLTAPDM